MGAAWGMPLCAPPPFAITWAGPSSQVVRLNLGALARAEHFHLCPRSWRALQRFPTGSLPLAQRDGASNSPARPLVPGDEPAVRRAAHLPRSEAPIPAGSGPRAPPARSHAPRSRSSPQHCHSQRRPFDPAGRSGSAAAAAAPPPPRPRSRFPGGAWEM